jgi:triacylglycerol esterase/lipase EstA (alpha/beta hydrolase family)
MLTRLVRLSLVAELAAYAVLGAAVHLRFGAGIPALFVAAIAFALGIRLLVVCVTSLHAWVNRSPRALEQQLRFVGTLALLAGEFRALLVDNLYGLPFESLALRPDPAPARDGRIPVVLVHGYFSNRAFFRAMVGWLEARGVGPVFTPNYRSVFASIEANSAELAIAIERIASQSGAARVVLVCHSMGGLIARHYLREHGCARVARLVTIASPHHGTVLASYGIGEHSRQMRRDSTFLRALGESEAASPPQVPATSVYTVHDNLVAPQETSRLGWARNVAVSGVGHLGILSFQPVFEIVLGELRAAGVAT